MLALTAIAYLVLVPALLVVRKRPAGRTLFAVGLVAVALAIFATIAGGFAAAPGLATVPLAASFRAAGEVARLRAAVSIGVLTLSCAWYVLILVSVD